MAIRRWHRLGSPSRPIMAYPMQSGGKSGGNVMTIEETQEVAARLASGLISGRSRREDLSSHRAVEIYFQCYDRLEKMEKEGAKKRRAEKGPAEHGQE